jgi:hypothetical protein
MKENNVMWQWINWIGGLDTVCSNSIILNINKSTMVAVQGAENNYMPDHSSPMQVYNFYRPPPPPQSQIENEMTSGG